MTDSCICDLNSTTLNDPWKPWIPCHVQKPSRSVKNRSIYILCMLDITDINHVC